jgi:hypothetical protein
MNFMKTMKKPVTLAMAGMMVFSLTATAGAKSPKMKS